MSDNPIITFDHVSKDYILYKSDKARFKALFFKPRNPKIHSALKDVSFTINRGESVGIIAAQSIGEPGTTVQVRVHC